MIKNGKNSFLASVLPAGVIIFIVLFMMGRYLLSGVPHEYLGPEFKGTFEGDYDFTLELARSIKQGGGVPLWSSTYSGPAFVFAANLHVLGQALLYFFTHNLALSIKIYQLIYFILAGLSMFYLARYLFGNALAALFCAVIYTFTPFFIGEMLAYLHYSTTYFCLPLAFLFILKALDSPRPLRFGLSASLVIAFNLLSHPQNVFIAGLFYFLFALGVLVLRTAGQPRAKQLKVFLLIFTVVLCLSMFFVLPTLVDGYPYTRSLTQGGTWLKPAGGSPDHHCVTHSQSLISAVTLFHWPWFITPLKNGIYPSFGYMLIFGLPFMLAAAGVFLGLRDKKYKKTALLFLLLGAISFLFSMGTRLGPLGPFSWAYKLVPYFHMARAPYRYFYQAVLSICLLSGIVFLKLPRSRAITLFLLVVFPYLYAANFYGNRYNWTFIPAKEPAYFSQVRGWLEENNKNEHRVVECFGTPGLLGIGQRMLPNGLDLLMRRIDKDHLDKYLSLFGIKYILAPRLHSQRHLTFDKPGYMPFPDAGPAGDAADEEYYSALTTDFLFVAERLMGDPAFRMHTAGTRDVAIFENKSAFDDHRLYRANGVMIVGGSNAYDILSLKRYGDNRPAPIFLAQSRNLEALPDIKKACGELVLHNTDFIDLFFLLNQGHLVKLCDLDNKDWIFYGGSLGVLQPVPALDHSLGNFLSGDLCFSDFAIATDKPAAECLITLQAPRPDYYRIMLRVFGGEGFGSLSCRLGANVLGRIDTGGYRGFRWVEVWEGNLEKGGHELSFRLENKAPVFLDAVAFIPEPQLYDELKSVRRDFSEIPVTYLINRQNIQRSSDNAQCSLYIGESGRYLVALKVRSTSADPQIQKAALQIDGRDAAAYEYRADPGTVSLIELGPVEFIEGRHELKIRDLSSAQVLELVSISKGSPDMRKAPVLVHTQAYYPGWQMSVGGRIVKPIVANMFLNGFILDATEKDFKVFYRNSRQAAGIIISLATLGIVLLLMILPERKRRR